MGMIVCIRVSLLKRGLLSHKFKWRYAHDADQWQIPKEVLSLIMFNTTPLIKKILPRIMLTLHLWSIDYSVFSWKLLPQMRSTLTLSYYLDRLRFEIQDVWDNAKEKRRIVSSNDYITDRWRRDDRTLENDVNIEEKIKAELSVLSLSLFSWSSQHYTSIEDTSWPIKWIRVWDPRCLGER